MLILVKREIPWLLVASIVIVIAVQVFLPSEPAPIRGIVENKTLIGIKLGVEDVIAEFTIYGINSTLDNWEELFDNGTAVTGDTEEYLNGLYDEVEYRMVVGYKEDMEEYTVNWEDFNKVEPYEIIYYSPSDEGHMIIKEVVRSTDQVD